jgi:hypothetical protein
MVTASALVMVIATPSRNVQQRYHLTRGSLLSPVSNRNPKPSLFTLSMCSYLRPAFVPCSTTVTGRPRTSCTFPRKPQRWSHLEPMIALLHLAEHRPMTKPRNQA